MDGQIRQLSAQTLVNRRGIIDRLLWFLRERGAESCGPRELRAFLAYLSAGTDGESRWGSAIANTARPASASTVKTYHGELRTFFRFLVAEEALAVSPMERLAPPVCRPDQVQPFTEAQVEALLAAAGRGDYPRRDRALLLFLLDTGARASEVCAIRVGDLDLQARKVMVTGKGNKRRALHFGRETARAVIAHLRDSQAAEEDFLFASERGGRQGEGLTRSGVFQLVQRLGENAGLTGVRCSPHTFRHTFAVMFLRHGGNTFSLQQLLGHTSLTMVRRYVALAEADLAAQHRQCSPADNLRRGSRP